MYNIERFHHILHGHGVPSLFGLPDNGKQFTLDERVSCHALLTRIQTTLEIEWRHQHQTNKRAWDIETARHRVYRDHRFQHYYDTKGKPLPIHDDRMPSQRTSCRCEGCNAPFAIRLPYRTLVPTVSQIIKRALHEDMKNYFHTVIDRCTRFCPDLKDVLTPASNLLHHCYYGYDPLTTEPRESGVHFIVTSVPDAVHGYVLTTVAKACGQQMADEIEYNVLPDCLAVFHWDHV